jgi:hypothetical protein
MEKKQTAVEWYENRLIELDIDFGGHKNYWIERKKIREQAKQMEKSQIEDAWYDGISGGQCGNSEEYYNETYGGNK